MLFFLLTVLGLEGVFVFAALWVEGDHVHRGASRGGKQLGGVGREAQLVGPAQNLWELRHLMEGGRERKKLWLN